MPTGPRLNTLLDAIVSDVRTALPSLRTCEIHDGRVNVEEVRRWARAAPAVLVTWLGTVKTEQPGLLWTDAHQQIGAYVLTRESPGLTRGAASRNIVDQLLLLLPRARWGQQGLGEATEIQAENLYSGKLDRTGVSLSAVTWRQTLRLENVDDRYCPPLPDELYLSINDGPFIDLTPGAVPSHARYFGWSDHRAVDTADFMAAHVSMTDIGKVPPRATAAYFWFGVPVAAGFPRGILFVGKRRVQTVRQLPNSVNDPHGVPHLIGITSRRQSTAIAGLGVHLVYP